MQQSDKTTTTPDVPARRESDEQSGSLTTRLEMLRDEIRLHLHLASMEAKESWQGLEVQLEGALRAASDKADAASQLAAETRDNAQGALEDLQARLELFQESLNKARGH